MSTILKDIKHIKYNFYNVICSLFPMRQEIILESHPDLACNTFELYKLLIDRGVNKDYKITWRVDDPDKYKDYLVPNVYFMENRPTKRIRKIKNYIRLNRAVLTISCNRILRKYYVSKEQLNIYIAHASYFKTCRIDISCDYYISQSPYFDKIIEEQTGLRHEQIIATGFPRNDQLFRDNDSMRKIYSDYDSFKKKIAWVPTFREHKNKTRIDCNSNFQLGFPIIYDEDTARRFNTYLVENNVLIVLKPHPAQDLSVFKELNLSNIRLLTSEELLKNDIQTNEFLEQTDAMIGDYSGIYYDYLLLDKPIGITLDDFEAYKSQKGVVFERPFDILKGEYIYNIDDMYSFISNVIQSIDRKKEERQAIKKLVNVYPYDMSTERLFNFISNKMGWDY